METAEERWERVGRILFWMGVFFVAMTAYGVYDGDDLRGLLMTLAPGAFCFGLWQLVSIRLDWLVYGGGGKTRRIVSAVLFGIGVVAILARWATHA